MRRQKPRPAAVRKAAQLGFEMRHEGPGAGGQAVKPVAVQSIAAKPGSCAP
jgi:hypothetical protein